MKKLSILTAALLVTVWLVPASSAAPQLGRVQQQQQDRVCFYQDIHYVGWEKCYYPGDEIADMRRDNNSVSSIRVYGRARVIVFDQTDFRGPGAEFGADVPDLERRSLNGSRTWNDRIQSFTVTGPGANRNNNGGGVFGRQPGPPPRQEPPRNVRDGVCLYEDRDFRGRSECFDGGEIGDLARSGLNDRVSSIRVFGNSRVMIFRDVNFRGESLIIERDVPDLGAIGLRSDRQSWNDQISSMDIDDGRDNRGRGRGFGRGRGPRW